MAGRALAIAAALLASTPAASADEPAPASLGRIVVTGSQIPRIEGESALPVQIIGREEIERSGALGIEELIGRITANFNGSVVAIGQNNEHPNYSGASLRGFGTHATLILLNGRRLANHAFSDEGGIGVDLNTIPLAAVERIEVLRDGASAIYGSDAIAGVINFILRSDFQGGAATFEQTHVERGGGSQRHETLALGAGNGASDGYNVFAVLTHQRQHALNAVARSFSKSAYRPDLGINGLNANSFPANIRVPGGFVNPAAPACTYQTVFSQGGCKYDPVREVDLLPPDDIIGLVARGSLNLRDDAQVYVELVGSRHKTTFASGPSPANSSSLPNNQPIVVPVGSPFYPARLGLTDDIVDPAYRALPVGRRVQVVESDQGRALVGWKGTLVGWAVDSAAAQATSHSTQRYIAGFLDGNRLADAFDAGLINPFGDSGPAGDASLLSTQLFGTARRSRGTTQMIDLRANRDVAQWRGGPVTLGVGIEARTESIRDVTTDIGVTVLGGQYSNSKSGSRRAQAAYFELVLPLARTLDAQLAVRGDRYSDFGTSVNPKAALRWQPWHALLFRASAGTGFRAPTLQELFATQVSFPDAPIGLGDPKRCPVTQLDSDCEPEVRVVVGGNPALAPERSRQYSFGLVFEPAKQASIGIDWWRLDLQHTISQLTDDIVLDGNDRFEGGNIVRGPADPAYPGLPGPIIRLVEINENLGRQSASGFDLDVRLRTPTTRYGVFRAELTGSYLINATFAYDGIHDVRTVGTFGTPRWQHTLTLDWARKPWQATLVQTWRAGTIDENLDPSGQQRRVGPYRLWDGQVQYLGIFDWRLALGVKNLFNTDPPSSNQRRTFQVGYDASYADPRGRTWYARATYRWR